MVEQKSKHTIALTRNQKWLLRVLQLFFTIAVPILLVLGSVRLVMSPLFLQIEYHRTDFPEDRYGFSREDRLEYAPYAIDYILNGEDIDYLGNLRLPRNQCQIGAENATSTGCLMYSRGELNHMRDVQTVTQIAYLVAIIVAGNVFLWAVWLWRNPVQRMYIWRGVQQGSIVTLSLIAAIVVVAIIAWDTFFTLFHTLFFESGTWRFAYSDTLIRLFPEQFWFDAAIVVGTLTSIGAIILFMLSKQGIRLLMQNPD